MRREVVGQFRGQFLNMDGTFRCAGKVVDDASCLFFVMGEDAKIHTYGAVKSESRQDISPLVTRYGPFADVRH